MTENEKQTGDMIILLMIAVLISLLFLFSVAGCDNPNTIWSDVPKIGEHGQN